ncbi:MAG: hypothetical protein ABI210_08415 [Abditibacteriaceae bacterium]
MNNHISSPKIACLAIALLSGASLCSFCVADEKTPPGVTLTKPANSAQGALIADNITYDNGIVSAQGTPEKPVTYRSGGVTVTAQKVLLDTNKRTLSASGTVIVTRELPGKRKLLRPNRLPSDYSHGVFTETLRGDMFFYDYGQQTGTLDNVKILLVDFNISADQLIINGQKYTAKNVVVTPGGLTEKELEIYGTPPLSIHAQWLTIDNSKDAPTGSADKAQDASVSHQPSLSAQGAGLYFRNTKILPVPSYVLQQTAFGGSRDPKAFSITPQISAGSADGLLLTTQLQYAFNRNNPSSLLAVADLGISLRQGFRGGLGLNSNNKLGFFNVNAHFNDIVTTQIDNRVRLDRLPEFNYQAPTLSLINLPGGRTAGLLLGMSVGHYRETNIDSGNEVESGRTQLYAKFTTRLRNPRGLYLEVSASRAKYSNYAQDYNTLGYEIGYYDNITKYIDGQFSFSHTTVSGATPFVFDNVEIRRELRSTFDILLTPRYIVPIDLRYDLDEKEFRDKSFGILRNYKTFAYGLTYNTAHRQLSLEFRQGF